MARIVEPRPSVHNHPETGPWPQDQADMGMWSHRLPAPLAGPSPAAHLLGWTCPHPPPVVGATGRPGVKYVKRSVRPVLMGR